MLFDENYLNSLSASKPTAADIPFTSTTTDKEDPRESLQHFEVDMFLRFSERNDWHFSSSMRRRAIRMEDPFYITDTAHRVIWVNQKYLKQSGLPSEKVLGKPAPFLESTEFTRLAESGQWPAKEQQVLQMDVLLHRQNSEPCLVRVEMCPVFDLRDRLVNYLVFENEITLI